MKFFLQTFALLLCLSVISKESFAQDPIFGQFYTAPSHLNPALAGVFEGQFRVGANYREQWQSIIPTAPFRTIAASFDYRLRVLRGDYAAFGANLLRDQAGTSNFTTTRGNIGFSYLKQLSGDRYSGNNQYLVAGGQIGMGQHSLDFGNLWFSSQWNNGTNSVDNTQPNGEQFNGGTTNIYTDFNAGLLWYAIFDDNFSLHAGGALHHITEPNISFLDNPEENLPHRWVLHVGGEIPFNKQLSILPAVMYTTQGPSRTTVLGANFRYTNRDWQEVALRVGAWGQISNKLENEILNNSVIIAAIVELERVNIGINYDVNTSSVANLSNGRGAYEVSITYIHPARYREKVKCPNY